MADGLDSSPIEESRDSVCGPERECLNRHRRLTATRSDKVAAVNNEEIRHVVSTMISVHNRRPRIISHSTSPKQMISASVRLARALGYFLRAGGDNQVVTDLPKVFTKFEIVGMAFERETRRGKSPLILYGRVEIDAVALGRKTAQVAICFEAF